MELSGKNFIVTGGASGLGAACAKAFVQKGARVALLDRNEDLGKKIQTELDGSLFIKTDVSDEDSVTNAISTVMEQWGALHGAINCAGVGFPEKILSKEGQPHTLKNFAKTINVNLVGSFNVARLACEQMAKNDPNSDGERGVIINTASVAAFDGQMGQVAYSASKGGIVAMTLPMARDLAKTGIRVMTIAPGIFDTPMLAGLPDNVKESLGQQVPFPSRLGRPDEYASMAIHIAENCMLNGETIRLDGAIRLAPR